jgi:hypothetical protein
VDIGRATILTRLLGSATVGTTLDVGGNFSVATNKFNVTAATGATAFAGDLNINAGKFTVAAATGNTVVGGSLIGNNATGFLIDASGAQPISIGTTAGTNAVTISRAGQTTTVAGLLTVTGASTFTGATTHNGTVQIGATGNVITEIKRGTCTIVATNVPAAGGGAANTACTIVGGVQDLRTFQVSIMPAAALPANIVYSVNFPSATQINIRWVNSGALVSTGALTFNWTAVR